jgi:hypothetical protein
MGSRILALDGDVAELRNRQMAVLGYDSGAGYARVLLWKHGVGPAMRTETPRLLETRNWLQSIVVPRRGQRA